MGQRVVLLAEEPIDRLLLATIVQRFAYRALEIPSRIQYEESYDFSPLTISVTATFAESDGRTQFVETLVYRTTQERDEDFPGIAESVPAAYAKLDRYLRDK